MTEIRRITEEDCAQDFKTGKHCFDFGRDGEKQDLKFYFERDKSKDYESYVLVEDKKVVAILCIRYLEESLYISRIGVQEGLRRHGYGAKLLVQAVQLAVSSGLHRITAEVDADGILLFERNLWVVTHRYYDEWWGESASIELTIS